jgi:HD-like signal output (HDOD) protein/prolyl-tRNA editing enzyme YbaK/EbsC (Cys-tRNA(Pro) deacylase)
MALVASRIEQYLDQRQIDYQVLAHKPTSSLQQAAESLAIPTETIIRAVVLKSDEQLVIAVMPLGRILDFNALTQATGRDFEPVSVASVAHIFQDCEAGMVPPLGSLYQLDTYCDSNVQHMQQVVFEAGSRRAFIKLNGKDFTPMIDRSCYLALSRAQHELEHLQLDGQLSSLEDFVPTHDVKDNLGQLYALPAKPLLLGQLQEMVSTGSADKTRLVELLQAEQLLCEQLTTLSLSTFFPGDTAKPVHTLDDAIDRLGIELCVKLAQGLLVWDRLELPPDGPLGKDSLVQQARLAAQVAHRLVHACGGIADVDASTAAYLALLHNVGYLVLSHLFAPEYFLFNRMVQANADMPVAVIEKQLLAYGQAHTLMQQGHAEVGAWLLQNWGFSEASSVICEQHHNDEYVGPYQQYVHLLILVNHLLKDSGLGDSGNTQIPENSLSLLGINDRSVDNFRNNILHPALQHRQTEYLSTGGII